ncbi:hypothetical protein IIA15_07965, partial [candidate division TA06 bacterium]|nr:hypothetical protein [candidate division TA06 bacterium]
MVKTFAFTMLILSGISQSGWTQLSQQVHIKNITFENTNHRLLQIDGGRLAWIEDHFGTGDPLLKWFTGFEILRVDSAMSRTDYKLDGRYLAYVNPADSLTLYDLYLWNSTPFFDLSPLPPGRQFDLQEDNLIYVEPISASQSQVNLYSISQSMSNPLSDPTYLYLRPVYDQGIMACIGIDFAGDTSSAVFWHDGNNFQVLSNFMQGNIDKLTLKDGMVVWRYTHMDTSRLYLFDGDSLTVEWESDSGHVSLMNVATGNGWYGYSWWDTLLGSGKVVFADPFTPQETTFTISEVPAVVIIDRDEGIYQIDTTFNNPQVFRYDFQTQQAEDLLFSKHQIAYDDGQPIGTFGDAVELRTTTTQEQLTSSINAGRVQTRYKCLDSTRVAWQEFVNPSDPFDDQSAIFYFNGVSIIQVTDTVDLFRDFLMTDNERLNYREEFNNTWFYDSLGVLQLIVDSLQSERLYLNGEEMVWDGFLLSDTNMIQQIWHYDFITSTMTPITQDSSTNVSNREAFVSNGHTIWMRDSSSTITLMHFDGFLSVALAANPFGYHIEDSIIVWSESDGSFQHLHIKNTQSGDTSQVTFDSLNDLNPLTDGRNLLFLREYPDTTYLMSYDL